MMDYTENRVNISVVGNDPAVAYAANELKKYIKEMTGGEVKIDTVHTYNISSQDQEQLYLGILSSFNGLSGCSLRSVADVSLDDAYSIQVSGGKGVIYGSNSRSVLLAVYRFLTEVGCRWVRPGKDGESIPHRGKASLSANIAEKAAYRHRGICIEGAVSYENVADMIDWMPKVGFNSYMLQFREAYNFFHRWYSHINNPYKKAEAFDVDKAREFCAQIGKELKKRDMAYHAVGHGWTCEPFGILGLDWEPREYDITDEVMQNFALINGKRQIWENIALNTSLCYSNSSTRRKVVENILDYLKKHKDIDVLHFWLADGYNNHCECDECRKMIPTDFYIKMLNELDEVLTLNGINTKVVFLVYCELLWPPQKEHINNPGRFILMFAPITRDYSVPLSSNDGIVQLPPYARNKITLPVNVQDNLAFLKEWQQIFKGDSFNFDYHMMWDHLKDPGYYKISGILNKDIKNLKDIGLNGYVSCQVQRAFLPTGLPMYVLGKTLWDSSLEFEDIAEEYFTSAFGDDGGLCMKYLETLSEHFDPPYLRGQKPAVDKGQSEKLIKIEKIISDFEPVIEKNIGNEEPCKAKSWFYLKLHAEACGQLAAALAARAKGNQKASNSYWKDLLRFLQENEDEVQEVFDLNNFVITYSGMFNEKN